MTATASTPRGFGDVRQLGYVVADLDAAVQAWSAQLGVGPWTFIRNIPLHCVYLGQPSTPLIDIALSYRGQMQVELIQQRNDAASPYRAEAGRQGLHHSAFLCEHIEEDVRRAEVQGLQVVCDIRMPAGGRYVYLQSPQLGENVYIEFLEVTEQMREMFAGGIAACAAWDGQGGNVVIDFAAMAGS
ncbi:VOC family protein [Solimonas sp. K1W22B-7]|uniref:VOC family protein n=1 Tax=Solimonas sp. K1W22B-7 TaxID=2303331 RepID=UPI000E32D8B7|nr:VOC family protein [Solimonas sp. K1W22B-7]AXQ28736.1 VOC family protein [Solimonas sp. K1W22B-7]